jgi:MarR family 2-MHQ and catechol resistance regulon transcriptional repressor
MDSLQLRQLLSMPARGRPDHEAGLADEAAVQSALHLWVVLARAHATVVAREQRDLYRYKLTRAEFGVLDALFFKGPLVLGEIQRKILVSSGGMTYLIDRLEKRGLVQRSPSRDDRRAIYAALTTQGQAFFREVFAEHVRGLAKSVSALTLDEQSDLTELLKKMGIGAARMTEGDARG